MIGHSEYAWVIDSSGHTRDILDTDPGPATSATESSFSVMLATTVKTVLDGAVTQKDRALSPSASLSAPS